VIIIITVLAGLVIAAIPRIEGMAKAAACASNLRQIGQAFKLYSVDFGGFFPPLIQPEAGATMPSVTDASKVMNPWYYVLSRSVDQQGRTIRNYGLDERMLQCPADKTFDPKRDFENLALKLTYFSDNISYGMNYDVKYANGKSYRVNPAGTFVDFAGATASTPSGSDRNPDYYRASEVDDPMTFILAADSNSELSTTGKFNFAISIYVNDAFWFKVGTRHWAVDRPGGNVLFADDHVEMWATLNPTLVRTADQAKNINETMNRRYWTLPGD
jgi:hypothetical protein